MLTVIREMAEEAELRDVRALPVVDGLARVVARGDDAVAPTPEMLDKLREAGVVDAGGAGLVELVRGVLHELTGEPLPDVPEVTEEITEESIHHEESEYRYCTVFVVEGDALDLDALHASLEPLGDSLLVTGDASVAKVHVHTDEPERRARPRPRGRASSTALASRSATCTARPSERERWLAQLHAAAQAPPAEVALVAVAQGGGQPRHPPQRGSGDRDRGRADDEPLGRADPRGRHRRQRRPRDRAAEQPERPPRRRERRGGVDEGRPRDRDGLRARGDRRRVRVRRRTGTSTPTRRRCASAIEGLAVGEIVQASRDATVDGVTAAEGDFLAHAGRAGVRGRRRARAVLDGLLDRFSQDGRSFVQVLRGEGAPEAGEIEPRIAARGLDAGREVGRPTPLPAPPLGGVARGDPGPARRGQRRLPLLARAPARAAAGPRGRRRGRQRLRGRRRRPSARSRRRRHGLPAARPRRRGRDARRDRGLGRRGALPHRGGDRRRARGDPARRRRRARREGRDGRRARGGDSRDAAPG